MNTTEICDTCFFSKSASSLYCVIHESTTQSGQSCFEWTKRQEQPMREKLEQIADGYEFNHQAVKLFEEMGELQQALAKTLLDNGPTSEYEASLPNLKEELADVQIMLLQIIYLLDISEEEFEELMEGKIDRTIGRMEGEKE